MFTVSLIQRWSIRTATLFLLLLSFQPALAAVSRRLSLPELVGGSTSIVVATCRTAQSRWTPDRSQIETVATYDVVETLKGPARSAVTVVSLGGVVDGVGMYVSGMPSFVPGRQELLFLSTSDASSMKVVGMAQGQFHVTRDSFGVESVSRSSNGTNLLGPKDPALDIRRLDALSTLVRRLGARN